MIDEPTYEYVKGQGWVASIEHKVLTKTKDGKDVWIIDRQAVKGEYWVVKENGETIEDIVKHVSNFRKEQWREPFDNHTHKTWTLIFI